MATKFIALIDGKDSPIFFKPAPRPELDEEANRALLLNYQFIAKMSLDFISGPEGTQRQQPSISQPALLIVHDGVAVYGALTNTRMKILLGTDAFSEPKDLHKKIKAISDAYIRNLCNPFGTKDKPLDESPAFRKQIDSLLEVPAKPETVQEPPQVQTPPTEEVSNITLAEPTERVAPATASN